ncbi:hypothetical protein [Dendrosporobacter sp. 1207_IL3150]|uniref:hypothetical protein n=1 Tax=Dendrosporobacter sp. 1207_IL3150 TaxID=3084054 RepID=UPI002FD8B0DA
MTTKWASLIGKFLYEHNLTTFKGYKSNSDFPGVGVAVCNSNFDGGIIEAELDFENIGHGTACQIIVSHSSHEFVTAGLTSSSDGSPSGMYYIGMFSNQRWNSLAVSGDSQNLTPGVKYNLKVEVKGSLVHLKVNDVLVLSAIVPQIRPRSQVGIYCTSAYDVFIRNFAITQERARAFVVMQFSSPYNEIYEDVIKEVCSQNRLTACRADDTYLPGLILGDIVQQIKEAKIIIADISKPNSNVYYEVGYAHALNKPCVLLAEKGTQLPFDVSAFRVLFYENTIPGKSRLQDSLTRYLDEILTRSL